jgi:hypothetical protein
MTNDPPIILLGDNPRLYGPPNPRFVAEGDTFGVIVLDHECRCGAEAWNRNAGPDDIRHVTCICEPFMWPTLDDLEPVTARDRAAADAVLFPRWPVLELVARPRTTFGALPPGAVKAWSAALFTDVVRESYFAGRLAGPPRSPDLYTRPKPPRTWADRWEDVCIRWRNRWWRLEDWWRRRPR